jgi:hypothetical protein
MQFLAVRSDRFVPLEHRDKYVHKLDVECHKCRKVTYQLRAPLLETEAEQVYAQRRWLATHLPTTCPEHPDWFLTPDRPE